jgi:hypothetical protein
MICSTQYEALWWTQRLELNMVQWLFFDRLVALKRLTHSIQSPFMIPHDQTP